MQLTTHISTSMNTQESPPNDKRSMPYGGAFAIQDSEIISYMKTINLVDSLWDDNVTSKFCNTYIDWIKATKNNTVLGLENFEHAVFSNGTTEAFMMFYIKNKNRRFRCFKGEFIFHQLAWRNDWNNWKYIEDCKLDKNDAVIISLPFSDTGNEHNQLEFILKTCNALGIPVLVDCAYFGMCSDIKINLNYKCITDVTFSLSKTFPVAHARIGMRLTKVDDDDLMFVHKKINYNNRIAAKLGIELMGKYSSDYVYNKYVTQQKDLCKKLDVLPSKCVIFGVDTNNLYSEYNRGGLTNRLGVYKKYEI